MGIFSVNVVAFAMIDGAYFNPAAYGGTTGADLALWLANTLVVDGKMRGLFSMLFGASMLLVIERRRGRGRVRLVHLRRMLVLLLIGLAHFYLIWCGDILPLYAAVGLVAFLFRHALPTNADRRDGRRPCWSMATAMLSGGAAYDDAARFERRRRRAPARAARRYRRAGMPSPAWAIQPDGREAGRATRRPTRGSYARPRSAR